MRNTIISFIAIIALLPLFAFADFPVGSFDEGASLYLDEAQAMTVASEDDAAAIPGKVPTLAPDPVYLIRNVVINGVGLTLIKSNPGNIADTFRNPSGYF